MRDINRLNNFYDKLKEIHLMFPDFRFGQLIYVFNEYLKKNNVDIFYLEEDKFLEYFEKYLQSK